MKDTRIGICTPCLVEGDAVSQDVLGMFRLFENRGYETKLFCETSSVPYPGTEKTEDITAFLREDWDIFIYHYSVGWDLGLRLFNSATCRKLIKYHNVTPPKYFEDIKKYACHFKLTS